jgi:pimeloyl-ACP methyl ester carboxylesterase
MASLSEERLAPANGIELAYQEVGDPAADPILLVMGLATQMLGWDEGLCEMLAERGFRVIRFGRDAEPRRHDARPPRPRPVPALGHGR